MVGGGCHSLILFPRIPTLENPPMERPSMTSEFWVIGVDGGGTKTTAVLADASGTERARRMTGASNPNVVGIETAVQHIAEAIIGCCTDAGISPASLSAVVCGLAGGSSEKNRNGIRTHILANFGG